MGIEHTCCIICTLVELKVEMEMFSTASLRNHLIGLGGELWGKDDNENIIELTKGNIINNGEWK